jgi:hypothetical protein
MRAGAPGSGEAPGRPPLSDVRERILAGIGPAEPLYAVLDGARDSRIRGWVLDTRLPAWCLYRGELPPALENASPWLVRLVPGHPALDSFLLRWGSAWGILLACAAPSRELRRHLRRFLRVRTEEGRILAFRYYDPRVLRAYLPTCTAEEIAAFFGPVSTFVAEEEGGGEAWFFRRSPAALDARRLRFSTPVAAAPQPRAP